MTQTGSNQRKLRLAVAGVFVAALVFGGWGLWRVVSPASADVRAQLADSRRALERLRGEHEELQQRVATLSRSDQISRDANRDLQGTLSERDEEIAGLRADVAFYERLVGATAQRRGLSVHALNMVPNESAWHFQTTLTQNLNRGAVSSGDLTVSIEGSRDGRLETLDWDALRQQEDAPPKDYSFKYFQQVEGDVFLPEDFNPVRVTVRLQPRSGRATEQSFTWADATRSSAPAIAAPAE
ncbi:DUF6776 family protein [Novilysobacter spongiicola]|uniref:Uncharacterized protein n=1 Tax=Lysobacter spongiicola DSM 21749 TaxID=1122188 RepID=A0A1T4QJ74_9GAMM|nr:DUF6776 family protein [Lysobacter spongiicola]SKA03742.1 hypothetical protein SAMN02745674_01645 [Lysobacter spongiicola DSM 21749]